MTSALASHLDTCEPMSSQNGIKQNYINQHHNKESVEGPSLAAGRPSLAAGSGISSPAYLFPRGS